MKEEYVLLLTSYCGEDNVLCSDMMPCHDCLMMCNIVKVSDIKIIHNYGGFEYNKEIT